MDQPAPVLLYYTNFSDNLIVRRWRLTHALFELDMCMLCLFYFCCEQ